MLGQGWLYWAALAVAGGLLTGPSLRSVWRNRARRRDSALWNQLHPAAPVSLTRELTVLGLAAGRVLNTEPDQDRRDALREHLDAVIDEELHAGSYSRLVADSMLAAATGLTSRLRAVGSER